MLVEQAQPLLLEPLRAGRGRPRSTSRPGASGRGSVSPSTVASSSASTLASRAWCSRVRLPRKPSQAKRHSSSAPPSMLLRGLEPRQLLVALVDRLDVERVLEAREVEVVLLVQVGDEPVGLVAECIDLARRRSVDGRPRIRLRAGADDHHRAAHPARRHHRTGARGGARGAAGAAVLVYVPHTTAGVTINEHVDPLVAATSRWRSSGSSPTAGAGSTSRRARRTRPSHIRAALMSPQVVIPLRDGELALGTLAGHLLLRARRAAHAVSCPCVTVAPVALPSRTWPPPFRETRSSSSRSTRSPTAATVSRASTASSCSCAAACPATRCARA